MGKGWFSYPEEGGISPVVGPTDSGYFFWFHHKCIRPSRQDEASRSLTANLQRIESAYACRMCMLLVIIHTLTVYNV